MKSPWFRSNPGMKSPWFQIKVWKVHGSGFEKEKKKFPLCYRWIAPKIRKSSQIGNFFWHPLSEAPSFRSRWNGMGLFEFFMFLYWDTPTYKITLKGVKKIYFVKFQTKFSYKIILDKKMGVYLILHKKCSKRICENSLQWNFSKLARAHFTTQI